MKQIIRTALGAKIQACLETNRPVVITPNSTLNQKLQIQAGLVYTDSERPYTQYVCIGNNGHAMSMGVNNTPKFKEVPHKPRHTGLYGMQPFILRRIDNDITAQERAKYRLRRQEVHGGDTYFAYYAKLLDGFATAAAQMELRTVINGTVTTTPFEFTAEDLNPPKPNVQPGYVLGTTGDYIATYVPGKFIMTPADMQEFADAMQIIYGEDGYATISEIATVAGVDRNVTVDNQGTPLNITEVIGASITNFMSSTYSADFHATGFELDVNLGSSEPLLEFQAP